MSCSYNPGAVHDSSPTEVVAKDYLDVKRTIISAVHAIHNLHLQRFNESCIFETRTKGEIKMHQSQG